MMIDRQEGYKKVAYTSNATNAAKQVRALQAYHKPIDVYYTHCDNKGRGT